MVSKAVPVAIGLVVLAAGVLALVFFTGREIEVGAPFDAEYAQCVGVLERAGSFVRAVRTGDVQACAGAGEFCRAVVNKDESACAGDAVCIALVQGDVSGCGDDADCRAFITGDAGECDAFSAVETDAREDCRALAGKDVRYFSSRRAQRNCLDGVVMALAGNATDCELISNRDVRASCEGRFT